MSYIAENFEINVNGEPYVITRLLEDTTNKYKLYGFKTIIDDKEIKLRTRLKTPLAQNLESQLGIRAVDELINVLLTEFQVEIEKITETK